MYNRFRMAICALALALLIAPSVLAQESPTDDIETDRRAQTGFKFLSMSVDARSAALADAMTAIEQGTSVAMFYNPAGMARLASMGHVQAGQAQWIADINHSVASAAFAPSGGAYGVFGITIQSVDYGDFVGTLRADNENGYEDFDDIGLANPSPTGLALGFGYAKALTDRFAVGGHIKYATQDLGDAPIGREGNAVEMDEYSKSAIAFDFGVMYQTGFRSLNFAMSARNFAQEITYVQDNFELPLLFRIGVSMDLLDFSSLNPDVHSFQVALEAERPRDFQERLKVGGEYLFMNTFAVRAGYAFPTDAQGVSLGLGLHPSLGSFGIGADYAYTTFEDFEGVHRLSLQFSF